MLLHESNGVVGGISQDGCILGLDPRSAAMPKWRKDDADRRKMDEDPMILLNEERPFYGRLLEDETRKNFGDSGRMNCRTPGSVPFRWETEPGKPRVPKVADDVLVLNLPPILRASRKSPTALVRQPSRSVSEKVINLLNGKFSGSRRLSTGDNLVSRQEMPRLGSLRLPFKKSTLGRSEGIDSNHAHNFRPKRNQSRHAKRMQSDALLTVNGSSKSLHDINSRNKSVSDRGCSPRSTLECTCDRSTYSSPFYFQSLDSPTSFSRHDSSISPVSSLSQESSGAPSSSTSSATAARTILANWFRSLGTNTEPDIAKHTGPNSTTTSDVFSRVTMSKSKCGSHPYDLMSKGNKSYSGPQPSNSRSKHPTPSRMYSGQTKFFSEPQEIFADQFPTNVSSGKKNVGVGSPTCSDLDALFPLKTVRSSFLKQVQQNISLEQFRVQSTCANMNSVESGNKDINVESATDQDDSKLFTFSPVASVFLFADSGSVSETTSFNRNFTRVSSRRIDPTTHTSNTENLSSPEIISMHPIARPHSESGRQSSATIGDPRKQGQDESIPNCRGSLTSRPEMFTETHGATSSELVIGSDSTRGAEQRAPVLARCATGSLSSHRILSKDMSAAKLQHRDGPVFGQDQMMTISRSSKISSVLLRQVTKVEEDLHRQKSLSKHAIMTRPKTSLSAVCSAFGRSVGRRSKVLTRGNLLNYKL